MADYNRNRGPYRTSNQDWNENRSRSSRYEDSDRNYGSSEFRGGDRDYDEGTAGWQSRHERERDDYGRGDMYSTGRYGRHYESDFNSGGYTGDRDYGYSSYYGSGSGASNYGGFSGDYRNRDRNLYDRDFEGMGRRGYSSSGTRFGAGNYGNYGEMGRYENEGRSQGRGGYGYSGGYAGEYESRNRGDRNWWDRTTDEVSSWFGDEEAERRRERDKQMGQYKGKGPKNYSRSDDRIKDDVNDRLSDDPFIDASEIEVSVTNGEVTLTGTVEHRSAKRRAEDLAEAVSGVKNVENRIRVGQTSDYRNPEKESQTTGSQATTTQSTSGVAGSERTRSKSYVTG